MLQDNNDVGWGAILRSGDLNKGGSKRSSVADAFTDYLSFDVFNTRQYRQHGLSVHTSIGWESLEPNAQEQDMDCALTSVNGSFEI